MPRNAKALKGQVPADEGIGFCYFLHGILFFLTKVRSKTEHEAPVSAIMIRGTDFSIPEASLKTTCDWKIK